MHNKAPMWNENSQVYQLDFGGRVTQESAKNFQIEYHGKQVSESITLQILYKMLKDVNLICDSILQWVEDPSQKIYLYVYIFFIYLQVMQFGRIDGNAYTLDFQYPFSALQAFAVALANVTQRLKWALAVTYSKRLRSYGFYNRCGA